MIGDLSFFRIFHNHQFTIEYYRLKMNHRSTDIPVVHFFVMRLKNFYRVRVMEVI